MRRGLVELACLGGLFIAIYVWRRVPQRDCGPPFGCDEGAAHWPIRFGRAPAPSPLPWHALGAGATGACAAPRKGPPARSAAARAIAASADARARNASHNGPLLFFSHAPRTGGARAPQGTRKHSQTAPRN